MIREIHRGLSNAIKAVGIDAPVLASDLKEPTKLPSIKIFIKPSSTKVNSNTRLTEYEIMIIYYNTNWREYYLEQYEVEEVFEELLLKGIELENGVWLELEELEFEPEAEMLCIYTKTTIDTYRDSEEEDEIMEEMSIYSNLREELKNEN